MWAHPSLDWIASYEATDSNEEEGRAREVADAHTHKQTHASGAVLEDLPNEGSSDRPFLASPDP